MKIFKQKYKTPSKKEFPPIITYHDKRYGGTKVDEQGRFYTVEDETQRLFRWERMIRKKERQKEQIKTCHSSGYGHTKYTICMQFTLVMDRVPEIRVSGNYPESAKNVLKGKLNNPFLHSTSTSKTQNPDFG